MLAGGAFAIGAANYSFGAALRPGPGYFPFGLGIILVLLGAVVLATSLIKLLTVPYRFLFPAIMAFCSIGVYTLSNNTFDVYCAAIFAVAGLLFNKQSFEPAPLILGFILGPLLEENLRRALLMSRGDWKQEARRRVRRVDLSNRLASRSQLYPGGLNWFVVMDSAGLSAVDGTCGS